MRKAKRKVKKLFSHLERGFRWLGVEKLKPAYLHIPKTGGTYLGQLELDKKPVLQPLVYLGHSYVIDSSDDMNVIYLEHALDRAKRSVLEPWEIQNYHMFSTVRNIFDWLVSYASHAGGWNPKYRNTEHYDYEAAQKGFDYLLKTIVNREYQWPGRRFIHSQLFSSGGDLVVDWLNSTASLDQDLEDFAKKYGYSYRGRPKQRLGNREDYRNYYDDGLLELVYETWSDEIDLLGFDFDGGARDTTKLPRAISEDVKKRVRYDWKRNLLSYDSSQ